mgnify:CR=1 FL=1
MFANIKENCAKEITIVLGGIFGLALFSEMAQAVTCTPTGVAAAEASVSFFVPFNLCGVSTNATPTTSVENTFVFESFLPGGTVVEGARTYPATAKVTIGMPVTRHPSRRSQRALLTHWAPVLGSGVKALERPRMQDTYRREEVIPQPTKPRPSHTAALTASPQRTHP